MFSLGNLVLIITTLGVCVGLSLKYPVAGIPLLMLLIYSIFGNVTSSNSSTKL